ncbi:MAG: TIM barrel protein, partial [Candidatus Thermoplasmatota archaeon]|nr:TIM barrel protein [Candidatus Thermoplasmatota archaeon]
MKIACVDTITPGNSMEERFQNLEKWGFDGIEIWGVVGEEGELDTMAKQVQELSASYKIKPACVVIASPAALAPFTEEFLESKLFAVKESIRIAAKLGAVTLYAMEEGAQSVPAISEAPTPSDEEREVMLKFFREAGKYAVDQGAILTLEPVNRYETHYINRVDQAIEICDTLGLESLKVMADSCELNMEESNISQAI